MTTLYYYPVPYNFVAGFEPTGGPAWSNGWNAFGPASYIPTLDTATTTGLYYNHDSRTQTAPPGGRICLGFNILHAINTTAGGAYSNPVLPPQHKWVRWRVQYHYGLNGKLGQWASQQSDSWYKPMVDRWHCRVRDWATPLTTFGPNYNSVPITWGVWGSGWIAGQVPSGLGIDISPNTRFNDTYNKSDCSAAFGFSRLVIEAESAYDPPAVQYWPTASARLRGPVDFRNASFDGSASSGGGLPITAWEWNFGDGATATGTAYPDHLYATAGTFGVTLKVTNSQGNANTSPPLQVTTYTIPGSGGQPEVPDPDPTPPPTVSPPSLPPTDTANVYYPVAKNWASEFSQWNFYSPGSVKAATVDTLPVVLADGRTDTGVTGSAANSVMSLHMPSDNNAVRRSPLPAGKEYKRMKVLVRSEDDAFDLAWELLVMSGSTEIGGIVSADGGVWNTGWIDLSTRKTDAAMDAIWLKLTDFTPASKVSEIRVVAEYGSPGTSMPAPPVIDSGFMKRLDGCVHVTVTPAAAGIPPAEDNDAPEWPADGIVGGGDLAAATIQNGITLPFGYGIGGYGLDAGCIDSNGVEIWVTDIEGWDDGLNAEFTGIDPALGTGTFVNNVRGSGRDVVVMGSMYSTDDIALREAKRRLSGCLSEPPHIGWLKVRNLILPVALSAPIKVDHVTTNQVDFEVTFKGVRAPHSLGMGVWREGQLHDRSFNSEGYTDFSLTGTTPMTPIIEATGPLPEGARIDAVSLGATYRSGGFVLAKALESGKRLSINSILRSVVQKGTKTPASDYINWSASRWMYIDPRGSRVLASVPNNTPSAHNAWRVICRELW